MMMSDEQVFETFKNVRWNSTGGKPVCPSCGVVDRYYFIKTREKFRCKDCDHTFSLTSKSIFASRKLGLRVYLTALVIFVNSAKGVSSLQMSRYLGTSYKTAWVLMHKIREALLNTRDETPLKGICEIDGLYTGHYIRPKNHKQKRIDRRKAYKPSKRTIISMKQRVTSASDPNIVGADRTLTFITKGEDFSEIKNIVYNYIKPGSELHADEHIGYDPFNAHYDLQRVNHSQEYCGVHGENNNQCESFNGRFRRLIKGQCHRLSTLYLSNYANEIAYREDMRRKDNKTIFNDVLSRCLNSPPSNEFAGYWKGNKRVAERLYA